MNGDLIKREIAGLDRMKAKIDARAEESRKAADDMRDIGGDVSCVVKKQNAIIARFRIPTDELVSVLEQYAVGLEIEAGVTRDQIKKLERMMAR